MWTPVSVAVLCGVFACSGAAALVFETLFFRLAGLALGNSVYAAAIVLFSFMAGLGLGNALAAPALRRFPRPLLVFAGLEALIGLYGALLVAGFPALGAGLAPLLARVAESGAALQALRLGVAFALFVAPAIAMGMTLPVLVGALAAHDANYGRVLGRLYGWNTLGAVLGVLAAERALVLHLGVTGAGLAAAALDGAAVCGALWLRRGRLPDRLRDADRRPAPAPVDGGQAALLAAAFLCGALLLALEVVWFRFFLLFTAALTWNLAILLATVLAGIAAGGLAGSAWFRLRPAAHRWSAHVAVLAGTGVALLYGGVAWLWPRAPGTATIVVCLVLMFPVSFASGLLFTLLGRALEARGLAPTVATGRLAVANTAGSALGSLVGGFLLLPRVGIEGSFALLALGYGVAAALALAGLGRPRFQPTRLAAAAGLYALAIATFPSGALATRILGMPGSIRADLLARGYELVAFREAVTETIQYFRKSLLGETQHHVLATNSHNMASDATRPRRYMKAYVYWPVAINPDLEDALLISYGVGATARALVETPTLRRIDVVDVSADILELNDVVYPDPAEQPLRDPRVHVHVEDGRFFLQTTKRRFDLITGEPPPPRHAGVGNLYSREYFQLIRNRLRDGGIVTYWLSTQQLRAVESKAVLRGFCEAFPECSLWSGAGLAWMMVGVKNPSGPASAEAFARQWRSPALRPELEALGFPDPESLGPTFLADGERLRRWIGDTPPLVDDFPQRIASHGVHVEPSDLRVYYELMADPANEENFFTSALLDRYWPDAFRRRSPEHSRRRALLGFGLWRDAPYRALHATLSHPELAPFLPWVLGSDADAIATVERALARDPDLLRDPDLPTEVYRHAAAAALVRRELPLFEEAVARWERRLAADGAPPRRREGPLYLRATVLLSLGEPQRAIDGIDGYLTGLDDPDSRQRAAQFWSWARAEFGVAPAGLALPGG